jgi:hypothetical protein
MAIPTSPLSQPYISSSIQASAVSDHFVLRGCPVSSAQYFPKSGIDFSDSFPVFSTLCIVFHGVQHREFNAAHGR